MGLGRQTAGARSLTLYLGSAGGQLESVLRRLRRV